MCWVTCVWLKAQSSFHRDLGHNQILFDQPSNAKSTFYGKYQRKSIVNITKQKQIPAFPLISTPRLTQIPNYNPNLTMMTPYQARPFLWRLLHVFPFVFASAFDLAIINPRPRRAFTAFPFPLEAEAEQFRHVGEARHEVGRQRLPKWLVYCFKREQTHILFTSHIRIAICRCGFTRLLANFGNLLSDT